MTTTEAPSPLDVAVTIDGIIRRLPELRDAVHHPPTLPDTDVHTPTTLATRAPLHVPAASLLDELTRGARHHRTRLAAHVTLTTATPYDTDDPLHRALLELSAAYADTHPHTSQQVIVHAVHDAATAVDKWARAVERVLGDTHSPWPLRVGAGVARCPRYPLRDVGRSRCGLTLKVSPDPTTGAPAHVFCDGGGHQWAGHTAWVELAGQLGPVS